MPSAVSARLTRGVTLEARATGQVIACVDGYSVSLGGFSAAAADRARDLRTGLPLASLASGCRAADREIDRLVRGLARQGLLEYRIGHEADTDQVVIEPQMADYWPRMPRLGDADVLVLSRFAYLRRRGDALVLESPRAGALFRICDPTVATMIAMLSAPHSVRRLRVEGHGPGTGLLALLVDCDILLKVDAGSRQSEENDPHLVLWDFHDLLFHTRSTEGRQANPLGGVYAHAGTVAPLPAVRPRWPGRKIDLCRFSGRPAQTGSEFAELLRERHSTRVFDARRPITLPELAAFLDAAARVLSQWSHREELGHARPMLGYTVRPYPSAGASYELELYVAVNRCEGLAHGFYHYDAGAHALVPIATGADALHALLTGAAFAMDAPAAPQVLITIAARFGRVSWKYSALAYALVLKDVGVLTQTLYLTATDLGLGGCAIGTADIDLFSRMTGIEFHIEGPVGQFALGRGAPSGYAD